MGDLNPNPRPQPLDNANGYARDGSQAFGLVPSSPYKPAPDTAPFYSQLSSLPHIQQRPDFRTPAHSSSHFGAQDRGTSSLNMSSMAGALPAYDSVEDSANLQGSQAIPRSHPGGMAPTMAYQAAQQINIAAQGAGSIPNYPYGAGYAIASYQQQAFGHPNQSRIAPGAAMPAASHNYAPPSQYMYYPSPYGQYSNSFSAQGPHVQGMYERRGSMAGTSGGGLMSPQHMGFPEHARMGPGTLQGDLQINRAQGMPHATSTSSIPRGPPRKPKQSGHALWVGNLPSGTTVVALKDHFSREATKDIESVFLISKSNCAFINYKSETTCAAAMQRFHDSRFNGVRLVCRLRRSSAPGSGIPTGPSAMVGSQPNPSPPRTPKVEVEATSLPEDGKPAQATQRQEAGALENTVSPSKYFIVKSLTLQDLELSVRNGIWATQSHNEDVLNKAFKITENVFLIFSANKSGEYFGYARMTSSILGDGSQFVPTAPKPEIIADAHDVPKSIPTPATEWAPKGKIIDDSARGTIFWEAELSEAEVEHDTDAPKKDETLADGDQATVAQSWGRPFKIEWISTNRLPFYRTRGLRNPWNANREVKIARDGTELEPSVGERLVAMFNRIGPSHAGPAMMPLHPQMAGLGMPPMRPF